MPRARGVTKNQARRDEGEIDELSEPAMKKKYGKLFYSPRTTPYIKISKNNRLMSRKI